MTSYKMDEPNELKIKATFSNCFWGLDGKGVFVLNERIRCAKQTCEELRTFYREKANIEEDYAKRLLKLSKTVLGTDEVGGIKKSFDTTRLELEAISHNHVNMSAEMRNQLEEPLSSFTASFRERRKLVQYSTDKLHRAKLVQEQQVQKAKEKYESDCVKVNGYIAQQNMLMGKELDKNNQKLEKTQASVQISNTEYQRALELLAATTERWKREWKAACDKYQTIEEERLDFIKGSLWSFTNVMSTACVQDGQASERIRLALEKVAVDEDIQLFIKENSTGQEIPAAPEYQNFYKKGFSSPKEPYTIAQFSRKENPQYQSFDMTTTTKSASNGEVTSGQYSQLYDNTEHAKFRTPHSPAVSSIYSTQTDLNDLRVPDLTDITPSRGRQPDLVVPNVSGSTKRDNLSPTKKAKAFFGLGKKIDHHKSTEQLGPIKSSISAPSYDPSVHAPTLEKSQKYRSMTFLDRRNEPNGNDRAQEYANYNGNNPESHYESKTTHTNTSPSTTGDGRRSYSISPTPNTLEGAARQPRLLRTNSPPLYTGVRNRTKLRTTYAREPNAQLNNEVAITTQPLRSESRNGSYERFRRYSSPLSEQASNSEAQGNFYDLNRPKSRNQQLSDQRQIPESTDLQSQTAYGARSGERTNRRISGSFSVKPQTMETESPPEGIIDRNVSRISYHSANQDLISTKEAQFKINSDYDSVNRSNSSTIYPPIRQRNSIRSKSAGDIRRATYTDDEKEILFYAKALYDYKAAIPEELSFQRGDIMAVLKTQEDGWWIGDHTSRRYVMRGLIPSNFFKLSAT